MLRVSLLLLGLLLLLSKGVNSGCAFLLPTAHSSSGSGGATGAIATATCTADSSFTRVGRAASSPPSSVYVNLPFCRRRCFYCDFPIKVCD